MSKERNMCAEIGCPAACCKDNHMLISAAELKQFPEAREVPFDSDFDDLGYQGTFYRDLQNGTYHLHNSGPCPRLGEDNSCTIYESRPQVCKSTPFAGHACSKFRRSSGLRPVAVAASSRSRG